MKITKEELAAQYEKLSNRELLRRVQGGTLTSLAFETACEELRSRGVEFETANEGSAGSQNGAADNLAEENQRGVDFVTLAHLVNPMRANLLRVHLQSEGIVVHVLGEHLGVMHMFLSAGTGGIRVQVRSDQMDRAREILAEFDRIEQTTDENDEQAELPEGDEEKHYSSERASPYSPPQSRVADVEQAKARHESLNRPATSLFFWLFAAIGIGTVLYIVATNLRIGN